MANEKERFEMLLEEVRDGVKLVAEGHETIRFEMKQMEERLVERFDTKINLVHSSLKNEIKVTAFALDSKIEETKHELKGDIKEIGQKLDEHIKHPAHAVS